MNVSSNDGTTTTTFGATPVMSSYLLAFIVSDFEYSTNEVGLPEGETMQRLGFFSLKLNCFSIKIHLKSLRPSR